MSAELMIKAYQAIENDCALTHLDKLVLLRWAWKSADPSNPYEIKYRTLSRDLGASRNGIRASVKRLVKAGYLMEVAVKVVAGQKFQTGQSVTPQTKTKGGQSVTRGGSVSDPQKGQSVTPLQKQTKKRAVPAPIFEDWLVLPKGKPPLLEYAALSPFQKEQLRLGRSVVIDGRLVTGGNFNE